jgi:hypothetical protein
MAGKPRSHRRDLAIRKQRHDPPSLQITHDCSIAVVLSERPVINTGNDERIGAWAGSSADHPQQGIVAYRQHQPLSEARRRPAAECQTQMVDNIFQPCRPARPHWDNAVAEPLGENPPPTMRYLTDEPARNHPKAHFPAGAG